MIKISLLNILRHKSRTFLSVFGIAIGVAAIIAMVSVVDGMFAEVQNAFSQMQGVTVYEEGQTPFFSKIDLSYESKLESIPGVKVAVPTIFAFANSIDEVSSGFYSVPPRLIGIDLTKQQMSSAAGFSGEIVAGRKLRAGDKGLVLISKQFADDHDKFCGNKIEINGKNFRIAGIYETGSSLLNTAIIMEFNDLKDLISFPTGKASMYSINLTNPEDDQKIVKMINFRYGDELKARSASDFSTQFGDILGSFRLLTAAVAAISAIVAGVGILNTMLMGVVERFKEIGTLKAVGWTNNEVLRMILYESAIIGIAGGLAGIAVGAFVSSVIETNFGLTTLVSFSLISQAFLFALVIGLVAGAYPAYVASKTDPIAAISTE